MNEANKLLRLIIDDLKLDSRLPLWLRDRVINHLANQETANTPIAYINLDEQRLEFAAPFEYKSSAFKQGKIPLYANTPALNEQISKKPLNGNQIMPAFDALGFTAYDYRLHCFLEGVRFAEQHHGIGGQE